MRNSIRMILLLLFSAPLTLLAQDVIFKADGTKVQGKVLEVGISEIRYKSSVNPEGPVYVIGKNDVVLIVYENGEHELLAPLSGKDRRRKVKDDSLALNKRKNIISLNLFDVGFANATLSYERIFGKGKVGLRLPFSVGLNSLDDYHYYRGTYDRSRVWGTGLDVNFYPTGQGVVRYFLGPSIAVGQYRFMNYYDWYPPYPQPYPSPYYSYHTATHFSFSINNGLMVQPSKELTLAFTAGLGMKMDDTPFNDRIEPRASAAVNIGYRF